MKKVTKAAIAAGAATALMLGGAGTLALWQDSKDISAGTVTSGHLTLDTTAAGAWTDTSSGAATTDFNPAVDHIVPGDTVVYNQAVRISADGKNLQGELTVGSLAAAIPAELAGQVDVTVEPSTADAGLTIAGSKVSFEEPGDYDLSVAITVAFLEGTAGTTPSETMNQPIDLTKLALTLNQVRPATP